MLGPALLWGDTGCASGPDTLDALALLLRRSSVQESGDESCPQIGVSVATNAGNLTWGDTDCSGSVDTPDVLPLLAFLANVEFDMPTNCPSVAAAILID
jgi:hypothetical protein